MKGSRKSILSIALGAVIAIAAIMPGLKAGPATTGRFKLPFDVQMGKMALSAGNYTFSVERSAGPNGLIRVYRGAEGVGLMLPQELDTHHGQHENPALLCVRHDGKVTVRALRWTNVGTYYFPMPKDLQKLVAEQPELIETVPVQVGE